MFSFGNKIIQNSSASPDMWSNSALHLLIFMTDTF